MDARITARFGEAARHAPLGTLVEHGPLAWIAGARRRFVTPVHVLVDGAWQEIEDGHRAFAAVVRAARPSLDEPACIIAAHQALTSDAPLLTRAQLDDVADPRFQLFPAGGVSLGAWHPPEVVTRGDVRALAWFVERFPHRGEIARVIVVDGSFEVHVDDVPR